MPGIDGVPPPQRGISSHLTDSQSPRISSIKEDLAYLHGSITVAGQRGVLTRLPPFDKTVFTTEQKRVWGTTLFLSMILWPPLLYFNRAHFGAPAGFIRCGKAVNSPLREFVVPERLDPS
jgi:hypothetical protein